MGYEETETVVMNEPGLPSAGSKVTAPVKYLIGLQTVVIEISRIWRNSF